MLNMNERRGRQERRDKDAELEEAEKDTGSYDSSGENGDHEKASRMQSLSEETKITDGEKKLIPELMDSIKAEHTVLPLPLDVSLLELTVVKLYLMN